VKNGDFTDTLKIAKILMHHKHDLIHKAVWRLLREVWKKDKAILLKFLEKNISNMHRTTLRYSIEKFTNEERKYYLKLK
jgi:3-methyladenine DNA glycosylase AlkD